MPSRERQSDQSGLVLPSGGELQTSRDWVYPSGQVRKDQSESLLVLPMKVEWPRLSQTAWFAHLARLREHPKVLTTRRWGTTRTTCQALGHHTV